MIESEFRDWTRAQLRRLDERIKAIADQKPQPAKRVVEARIHDTIVGLASKLLEEAKAGRIVGAAIAYVGDDERIMTGWSADGGYFALAGATAFMGQEILEEFRKAEPTNDAGEPENPG